MESLPSGMLQYERLRTNADARMTPQKRLLSLVLRGGNLQICIRTCFCVTAGTHRRRYPNLLLCYRRHTRTALTFITRGW